MLVDCVGMTARPRAVQTPEEAAPPIPAADTTWAYSPMQVETLPSACADAPMLRDAKSLHFTPYAFAQPVSSISEENAPAESRADVRGGYRVQLFAGKEYNAALKVKTEAEARLNVPIYVIFVAPQYKVRAGDFVQRTDAENLCSIAQAQGFKDAWVVWSQVEAAP